MTVVSFGAALSLQVVLSLLAAPSSEAALSSFILVGCLVALASAHKSIGIALSSFGPCLLLPDPCRGVVPLSRRSCDPRGAF